MKRDINKVIIDVKNLASKLNKIPTSTEFKKEYNYDPYYYEKYSEIVKKAGFNVDINLKLDKEKLENSVKNYIKEYGVYPPLSFIHSFTSSTTIKKHYKSMRAFKSMFVEEKKEYSFNKNQLIEFLQNKIDSGEIYSTCFFDKKGNISLTFVLHKLECKNWEEVLELLNRKGILRKKIDYEKEKIKKEYIELSKKLNLKNGARIQDIKKYLDYKINKLIYLFGGLRGLKKETGYYDNKSKARVNYIKLKSDILKLFREKGEMKEKELKDELKKRELASIDTIKTAFKVNSLKELYLLLKKEQD
jgi:hypothetical protein